MKEPPVNETMPLKAVAIFMVLIATVTACGDKNPPHNKSPGTVDEISAKYLGVDDVWHVTCIGGGGYTTYDGDVTDITIGTSYLHAYELPTKQEKYFVNAQCVVSRLK